MAESLEMNKGLSLKFNQAKCFYGVIILSVLMGIGINFTNIKPFKMLYYSAALNGLFAPFLYWSDCDHCQ